MAALEEWVQSKNCRNIISVLKGDGKFLISTEYIDGEYLNVKDSFKSYPSLAASVQGLYDLMQWDNYDRATSCTDYEEECRMVQACGYATDPNYSDKLISIVNSYQLTMFNNIEEPAEEPTEEPAEPEETSEESFIYTVQTGDTLWGIVRNYYNFDNDINTIIRSRSC